MFEEQKIKEINQAVLVGLNCPGLSPAENASEDSLEELAALLDTAGGTCLGTVLQNKNSPDPRTFIGEGKVEEVRELAGSLGADLVIFDNPLSPSQQRVLTEELGVTVMDRAGLILDIFAKRARTSEGRLQVALAQYKYLLPRLTGMWKHLERQEGAIGTRGPGETQLESDRRHIHRKIAKLEEEQLQELYALSELGKPIVMVLFCGRALVLSDALPFCNALLNAWFPGSEGAEAIRRLLVGEENPSGHLPVTFPRCTGQIPIHHDRIPTGRPYTTEENRYSCRYLDEKNAPLFPFGFGLSYTQFEISDICADTDVIQANEPFHVTAKVRNAGNRAGETVIQLYSNVHVPGQLTPVRSLTDWQRICLGVGQQMKVTFELTLAQLSQLDAEGRTVTPRGKVRIAVGEDSRAPFTVTLPVEA